MLQSALEPVAAPSWDDGELDDETVLEKPCVEVNWKDEELRERLSQPSALVIAADAATTRVIGCSAQKGVAVASCTVTEGGVSSSYDIVKHGAASEDGAVLSLCIPSAPSDLAARVLLLRVMRSCTPQRVFVLQCLHAPYHITQYGLHVLRNEAAANELPSFTPIPHSLIMTGLAAASLAECEARGVAAVCSVVIHDEHTPSLETLARFEPLFKAVEQTRAWLPMRYPKTMKAGECNNLYI